MNVRKYKAIVFLAMRLFDDIVSDIHKLISIFHISNFNMTGYLLFYLSGQRFPGPILMNNKFLDNATTLQFRLLSVITV